MKRLGVLCLFLALGLILRAADAPVELSHEELVATLTAVDNQRVAAMLAADQLTLDLICSDDLRYASWSGKVDNKNSLIQSLTSHSTVYENYEYKGRTFRSVAPGVALMTGRAIVQLHTGDDNQTVDLNFLAVWREENGKWRFLAWQSAKNE